uniref:Uncharacterized protein n=1 Tax=Kalanchoe fedtschenkoi TaxID=63787 RepID=A0A7N1A5Y2_KALFE
MSYTATVCFHQKFFPFSLFLYVMFHIKGRSWECITFVFCKKMTLIHYINLEVLMLQTIQEYRPCRGRIMTKPVTISVPDNIDEGSLVTHRKSGDPVPLLNSELENMCPMKQKDGSLHILLVFDTVPS